MENYLNLIDQIQDQINMKKTVSQKTFKFGGEEMRSKGEYIFQLWLLEKMSWSVVYQNCNENNSGEDGHGKWRG